METFEIPISTKNFIAENFDSVEELEIFLLLRNYPEKNWTAESVSAELRSTPESAAKRLWQLKTKKLLMTVHEKNYQYQSQDPTTTLMIENLVELYRERRFRIIELIFSKPTDKLKVFANAFRIKRNPSDDR